MMQTFTPDMTRWPKTLSNSVPREVHAVGEAVGRLTDETKAGQTVQVAALGALRADCAALRRQLVLIGWTLVGVVVAALIALVVVLL